MAHYMKVTGKYGRDLFGATSRYSRSRVLQYTEAKLLTLETYKRPKKIPASGMWMEITAKHEYRPDLVSTEVYGTPNFWWRIMEANRMNDIMQFKAGQNIVLPGSIM